MPNDNDDLVLSALYAIAQSTGDDAVAKEVNECIAIYLERRDKAAGSPDFKRYQDALAKGLPDMAKGVFAAISAFQNGDAAEGLAAVMDSCASIANTIAGLVGGATGIPLIGAVFSVFAQLVRFMRKKTESTNDQFEKILRELQAEHTFQDILTARDHIKRFDTAIAEAITNLKATGDVATLRNVVQSLNTIEGDAIGRITEVCHWLDTAGNQALPLWPDVLGALCRTYADRTISAAKICGTMAEVHEKLKGAPDAEKPKIETEMAKLLSSINAFLIGVHADYPRQLQFMDAVTKAARNRGTLWSLYDQLGAEIPRRSGGGLLHARDRVIDGADNWTILRRANSGSMSVVRTRSYDEPSAHPYLSIVLLEPAHDGGRVHIRHGRWPISGDGAWTQLELFKGSRDIQLGSIPLVSDGQHTVDRLYFVVVSGDGTSVKEFLENPTADKIEEVRSLSGPEQRRALAARVVFQPRPIAHFASGSRLIYSCWSSPGATTAETIRCHCVKKDGLTSQRTFPAPWDRISGMAVDRTYLWAFQEGYIACAAHEDLAPREGAPVRPAWMVYRIPDEVGGYDPSKAYREPYKDHDEYFGLSDLSACDDGTLTAVFYERTNKRFRTRMFTMTPRMDRVKITLTLEGQKTDDRGNPVKTHGWVKCWDGEFLVSGVQKQPIFCWSLMEGIRAAVQKPPAPAPPK